MRAFLASLAFSAAIATLGGRPAAAGEAVPQVVPALQEWTAGQGELAVNDGLVVVDARYQAQLAAVNKLLAADLLAMGRGSPEIFLTLSGSQAKHGPEGYSLTIGDRVVISGNSPAGVFFGTRTLLQMLGHSSALPKGKAVDWPDYSHRMLMLDVGRKPFPLPVLKDYLRIMAWYKMNELHLHLSDEAFGGKYAGFRVQCDTFPGLASKDLFYTKRELRELQDQAHAYGITITPEIDMPGHSRVFTDYWPDLRLAHNSPSYLDVTNPQTIVRLKKLLDEMIPLFDAPDFHIGTDEYRVGGSVEEQTRLHEAFRGFINTMNAHIRAHGKTCRIWSGFEHMRGTTEIDPTVTIDMWLTDDAKRLIAQGHHVISSSDGRTYIVPGAHYYGVSNEGIYGSWEPWIVTGNMALNPAKGDPHLLGGKLHVWNDQGPTGYTMTEIATLALPSIQTFAEKLWGRKGSANFAEFSRRAAKTLPVPDVTVFERLASGPGGVSLDLPQEQVLASPAAKLALPRACITAIVDLEYPWTLTMEICKTAETGKRGAILSSDLAEICADYRVGDKTGFGVIRAAGAPGIDPASAYLAHDVSRIYGPSPALNTWTAITLVGERRRTTLYVNGRQVGEQGEQGEQTLCPLAFLGSKTGNSFVGKIRNLKVLDRALSAKEIGRSAGVYVPENLAAGKRATASAADTSYGFTPEKLTDEDLGTRWSSGVTSAEQWVAIDLGQPAVFNSLDIAWEKAFAKKYRIQVGDDGRNWRDVYEGTGQQGKTSARFVTTRARHVRLVMSQPATGWGYSIYEVEVLKRAEP